MKFYHFFIFVFLHDQLSRIVANTDANVDVERPSNRDSLFGRNNYRKRELRRGWRTKREVPEEDFDEDEKSHGSHFGYRHNTEEWGKSYSTCLGTRQSPIDLDSNQMVKLEVPSRLVWRGYSISPSNMVLVNNGHTVQLSASWEAANEIPYISGGPLESEYAFAQLHFHWGSSDEVGSEHTINNRTLPLEMHLVHYKKNYGSASEALKYEDGLSVIGILFEISDIANSGISLIQQNANNIKVPNTDVEIEPFPLSQFDLDFPDEYVAYSGSLTTPPCSEIVTWILPAVPRFLTEDQLAEFRSIELNDGDDHNFRPTNPRNDRMIYYISS